VASTNNTSHQFTVFWDVGRTQTLANLLASVTSTDAKRHGMLPESTQTDPVSTGGDGHDPGDKDGSADGTPAPVDSCPIPRGLCLSLVVKSIQPLPSVIHPSPQVVGYAERAKFKSSRHSRGPLAVP